MVKLFWLLGLGPQFGLPRHFARNGVNQIFQLYESFTNHRNVLPAITVDNAVEHTPEPSANGTCLHTWVCFLHAAQNTGARKIVKGGDFCQMGKITN